VPVEAKDLNLEMLKKVAIVPMDGAPVAQGATDGGDWSLMTFPKNKG
jgi:hypothetical protein